jgi:hypothetical protein
VENVRLAALCGLLRCEIAEDPNGNRRRRYVTASAAGARVGSSEKWRRPVSTGVRIPGSGPAANTDDRSTGRRSQCIMRTILRTEFDRRRGELTLSHTLSRCLDTGRAGRNAQERRAIARPPAVDRLVAGADKEG